MSQSALIHLLHDIRTRFDATSRSRRRELLKKAASQPITDPESIRSIHDTLLFIAAHPDDADMLRRADRELRRIAKAVSALPPKQRKTLRNSGIAGSFTTHAFTVDLIRWLIKGEPRHVDLDWINTEAVEKLEQFLPHLCAHIDADGLLNQRFTTRDWVDQARGKSSALDWLLDRFALTPATPALREQAFESLGFDIQWTHHDMERSRTGARFPARPIYCQRSEFTRGVNVKELLSRPLCGNKPLPMKQAARLLDACRSALAARRRETDPVTYANDREITLFQLDHGIDVAIIGMKPDRRLPIESFFGYVAARNRIPCSYGGGWVLGRRCEIGVNIFDEFRGGESALLFAQIMRVYHRHFGVTRFLVDPFQFGAGNAEAIKSGAFWFYHRLGFRPVDAALHRLAENEAAKIQADRTHRSSAATLRRLAGDKVRFDLDAAPVVAGDLDLADLGIAVTHWIGKRFDGDVAAAGEWSERYIRRMLDIRPNKAASEFERSAFMQWLILFSMIVDIKKWSAAEKQLASKIIRAKIGPSERTFALALQRHPRLLSALAKIALSGSKLNPRTR